MSIWKTKSLAALLAGTILTVVAQPGHAFKFGTHIWLADNIASDVLDDGHLSLLNKDNTEFAKIAVDPLIVASIRHHRGAFTFGAQGPDIFPDMPAGQMTTHPGLPLRPDPSSVPTEVRQIAQQLGLRRRYANAAGWQTDDFLQHVRDSAFQDAARSGSNRSQGSAAIAFAYGYLMHAAMDSWSHSYVNMFAGDLFSIVENQAVAARHTALEGFFERVHVRLQPVTGAQTQRSASRRVANLVEHARSFGNPVNDRLSRLRAPSSFVRKTLILNEKIAEQHSRQAAALPVWGMWAWWQTARNTRSSMRAVQRDIDRTIDGLTRQVTSAEGAWNAAQQTKDAAVSAASIAFNTFRQAEQAALNAGANLERTSNDVLRAIENDVVLGSLYRAAGEVINSIINSLPGPLREAYQAATRAVADAQRRLTSADRTYRRLVRERDAALDAFEEAARTLNLKRSSLAGVADARQQAWRLANSAVLGWQTNIEAAVDAYVDALQETAREIIRPNGDRFNPSGSATWPLTVWAACWGPAFGMSSAASVSRSCSNQLDRLSRANQQFGALLNNALIPEPIKQRIIEIDEHMQQAVTDALPGIGALIRTAIPTAAGTVAPGSLEFIARMWDHSVDERDLANAFSGDSSEKNLQLYTGNTVVQMLEEDGLPTRRTAKGERIYRRATFDEMLSFTPIRNAVTLSKLTLMSGSALNSLARNASVSSTIYVSSPGGGQPLYPANAKAGVVLMNAIRNIDGNHQWLPTAPALPARPGASTAPRATAENCRRFGYPFGARYRTLRSLPSDCASKPPLPSNQRMGFRLWQDPTARKNVFNCIFKGPVSTGMCNKLKRDTGKVAHHLGCGNEPFPDPYLSFKAPLLKVATRPSSAADPCDKSSATRPTKATDTAPAKLAKKTPIKPIGKGATQTSPKTASPAKRPPTPKPGVARKRES